MILSSQLRSGLRAVALSSSIGAFCPLPVPMTWATLYECLDDSGAMVLTDSPAQLAACSPVETSVGPERSAGARPPSASHSGDARPPQTSAVRQPRSRPQSGLAPRPAPVMPPNATPPARPLASPPSSAEQRCTTAVNPLNPLLTVPCRPADRPK